MTIIRQGYPRKETIKVVGKISEADALRELAQFMDDNGYNTIERLWFNMRPPHTCLSVTLLKRTYCG
jgi:hypothetical protein